MRPSIMVSFTGTEWISSGATANRFSASTVRSACFADLKRAGYVVQAQLVGAVDRVAAQGVVEVNPLARNECAVAGNPGRFRVTAASIWVSGAISLIRTPGMSEPYVTSAPERTRSP
jgi:hypothetical protein